MQLSEKIKHLRKSVDLTQEQMAEYLGISPQAVSRWECGTTCPDIFALPQIAQLFNITVDELLGADPMAKEQKIAEIVKKADGQIDQGITDEPIKELREALVRYPNNDKLLCSLMYGLYAATEDENMLRQYDEEIIFIARWIRQYSLDDYCRNESRRLLFRHYCDTNRKAEAFTILQSMPEMDHSRDVNMYWVLDGDDKIEHLKTRISTGLRDLSWAIWAYSEKAPIGSDEKNELNNLRHNIEKSVKDKFTVVHYYH